MTVAVPPPVVQGVWQAVIDARLALTVDCEADTPVVPTVTVAVGVMPTLLADAEIVFVSGTVEFSVQVATPLPFAVCVAPTGFVTLAVPETASVTLAPGTPLPN